MDLKTQIAVERQLAIIGEALNQYDKQPERDTLVWAIVVNHLPALKSEVKTLLENC